MRPLLCLPPWSTSGRAPHFGRCSLVLLLGLLSAANANGQAITVLHAFEGGANDGMTLSYNNSLIQSGSTLYGMTIAGGGSDLGTIYSLGMDGAGYSVIHSFDGGVTDGAEPHGSLVQSGSTLYGMAPGGGSAGGGVIFTIGTNGTGFTVLRSFAQTDGNEPEGSLILSGSTLFGMTQTNGANQAGTIFKVGTDGTGYTVLHSFGGGAADGGTPAASLVLVGSTLYGMTVAGGSFGKGTIFKIGSDGSGFSVLHSFGGPGDGQNPVGSLIISGSTLYGVTPDGGLGTYQGTVFKIGVDGSGYSVLHEFGALANDGNAPFGDLFVAGSKLYGTASLGGSDSLGTLFGIGTDGADYATLYNFEGGPDGVGYPGTSMLWSGSTFYALAGQVNGNSLGGIFSFTSVPEPSSLFLVIASGCLAFTAGRWRCRGRQQGDVVAASGEVKP